MTRFQKVAIAVLLGGACVLILREHHVARDLVAKNKSLTRENQDFARQLVPLREENALLSNRLAQSNTTDLNEVFRLRAEVTRLQEAAKVQQATGIAGDLADPINAMLETWSVRVTNLKKRLEQSPQTHIPELQYLTDKDWIDAVARLSKLETDEDYRQALNALRAQAKAEVGGEIQKAVRKYADANDGMLPENLAQVEQYLEKPFDSAMLDRYKMVGTGKLDDLRKDQSLFEEVAPPVDEEYDTFFRFHKNGRSSTSYSQIGFMIEAAAEAYANVNGGKLPREPSQLNGYLQRPLDPGRVQQFLNGIPPNITTFAEMKARNN